MALSPAIPFPGGSVGGGQFEPATAAGQHRSDPSAPVGFSETLLGFLIQILVGSLMLHSWP